MSVNLKGILSPFSALKHLGKKPHTVKYPYESKQTAERYRGLHFNKLDDCIGCGTCSAICQNEAIDMINLTDIVGDKGDSGLRPRVDNGRCCWCALCVEVCPAGSLSLTKDYTYVTDDPDSFLLIPGLDNADRESEISYVSDPDNSLVQFDRVPMRELDGMERVESFAEVVLGYDKAEAEKEAQRCISCSLCTEVCPVHMHIPEYINAIGAGKTEEAVKIIYDNNPLGESCGKVCTRRCEDVCAIGVRGESVAIRWLKRYATETVNNIDIIKEIVNPEIKQPNGHKVAIIGAGPSGLTAAYYLALKGFDVTIFEAKEHGGGMIMYGIPKYRLPFESIQKQITYMESIGVKIKYNTKVGIDVKFEELQEEFEAIFIGIGFEVPYKTGITGEDAKGSIQAIDYLRDIHQEKTVDVGKNVVVVGGGNVAIDAARVSKRHGADVTIMYRRRIEDMPADWEEIEGAEDEGIHIMTQAIPLEIISDESGQVTDVKYGKAEMVADGKGGRPRPKLIEGKDYLHKTSTIIGAIGQEADYAFLPEDVKAKIEFKWSNIITNEFKQTGVPYIFAGGDIANDTADAISAIADGYRAVIGIENFILGKKK